MLPGVVIGYILTDLTLQISYVSFYNPVSTTNRTHLNGSSVVICISVATGMHVYQTVFQQWSIPAFSRECA
jgi:hypothetical protein